MITKLYIRCYSRQPRENEMAQLLKIVTDSKNKKNALLDIFWALLNSKEFIFVR